MITTNSVSRSYTCSFFFNDTATTEIYTLSLHDALPICRRLRAPALSHQRHQRQCPVQPLHLRRSEEHTSELQSRRDLVCRLLLEKKKKKNSITSIPSNIVLALEPPAPLGRFTQHVLSLK